MADTAPMTARQEISMSDAPSSGFGKFVPGFEFLQNLAGQAAGGVAQGISQNIPQLPNLGNWVAPTFNVEDLEKRIEELKAVHFWLDQNAKALGATIQALEVQKMTLSTLKTMNFSMGDVANALKIKAADKLAGFTGSAAPAPSQFAGLEIPPRTYGAAEATPPVARPSKPRRNSAGGSDAMVGGVVTAVPADCEQRDEGRGQADRARHHEAGRDGSDRPGFEDRHRYGWQGRPRRGACGGEGRGRTAGRRQGRPKTRPCCQAARRCRKESLVHTASCRGRLDPAQCLFPRPGTRRAPAGDQKNRGQETRRPQSPAPQDLQPTMTRPRRFVRTMPRRP